MSDDASDGLDLDPGNEIDVYDVGGAGLDPVVDAEIIDDGGEVEVIIEGEVVDDDQEPEPEPTDDVAISIDEPQSATSDSSPASRGGGGGGGGGKGRRQRHSARGGGGGGVHVSLISFAGALSGWFSPRASVASGNRLLDLSGNTGISTGRRPRAGVGRRPTRS